MRIARCEQKLSQDNIYIHITKGQLLDLNSGISKDKLNKKSRNNFFCSGKNIINTIEVVIFGFIEGIWTYKLAKSVLYYTELEKKKKICRKFGFFSWIWKYIPAAFVNLEIPSWIWKFPSGFALGKFSNSLGYFQIPSGSGNICPYSLEKPEFPIQK